MKQQATVFLPDGHAHTHGDVDSIEVDEGHLYVRSVGSTVVYAAREWIRSETVAVEA